VSGQRTPAPTNNKLKLEKKENGRRASVMQRAYIPANPRNPFLYPSHHHHHHHHLHNSPVSLATVAASRQKLATVMTHRPTRQRRYREDKSAATLRVSGLCAGAFLLLFAYAVWPGVPGASASASQVCGIASYQPNALAVDADPTIDAKPPPPPDSYDTDKLTAACLSQCLDNVEWYMSIEQSSPSSAHRKEEEERQDVDPLPEKRHPSGPMKIIDKIWSKIRKHLRPVAIEGFDSESTDFACDYCMERCARITSTLYNPNILGAMAGVEDHMARMRLMMDDLHEQMTGYVWDLFECNCVAIQALYPQDHAPGEGHMTPATSDSSEQQEGKEVDMSPLALHKRRENWCRSVICPIRVERRTALTRLLSTATKQVWAALLAAEYAIGVSWSHEMTSLNNMLYPDPVVPDEPA
jgi:hypothetical protein